MDAKLTQQGHYLRNVVIFAACLAAVFVLPFIALILNSDLLFFAPQLLFPYDALVVSEDGHSRSILSDAAARPLNVAQWVVPAAAFIYYGRRLSFGRAVLLSAATIVAVGLVTQFVLRAFSIGVSLDGPSHQHSLTKRSRQRRSAAWVPLRGRHVLLRRA
jgi:hypothetical protein